MTKQPSPKADGLRAMRERKFAERKARVTVDDLRKIEAGASDRAKASATKASDKRAARLAKNKGDAI